MPRLDVLRISHHSVTVLPLFSHAVATLIADTDAHEAMDIFRGFYNAYRKNRTNFS
jgi:hypothetical protein